MTADAVGLDPSKKTQLDAYFIKKSQPFLPILSAIEQVGGRPVFVGGVVRDFFLGQETQDIDLEVFNLTQAALEQVLETLGGFSYVGKAYGVYVGEGIEIALPRLERKTGKRHQDFEVALHPELAFKEAAKRRDLTMNAMGYDWCARTFLDPYGGLQDSAEKRLRYVNAQTFPEDELRALRVAAFIARFGFDPDEVLTRLCAEAELSHLSPERIGEELKKVLFKGKYASKSLDFVSKTGLLEPIFTQNYPEKSWNWVKKGVNLSILSPNLAHKEVFVLAVLMIWGQVEVVFSRLLRLGFSKKILGISRHLAEVVLTLKKAPYKSAWMEALYHVTLKGGSVKQVQDLLQVLAEPSFVALKSKVAQINERDLIPLITADDLMQRGVYPGKEFGVRLKKARLIQYEEGLKNKEELLDRVLSV